jgi:hypothetical protein
VSTAVAPGLCKWGRRLQRCKPVAGENLPRGLADQKVREPRRLRGSPDRQRHRIRDGWVTVYVGISIWRLVFSMTNHVKSSPGNTGSRW